PRSPRWHSVLAEVLEAKGAHDEAIAEYSQVLELTPEDTRTLFARGCVYYSRLGQYKKAIADFSKASELEPNYWKFHDSLGTALLSDGQGDQAIVEYRKAIAAYRKTIQLRPDDRRSP